MRIFILFLFFLFQNSLIAQPSARLEMDGSYTEVVDVELNADVLYQNTSEWIASNLTDPLDVIVADEKDKVIKLHGHFEPSGNGAQSNPGFFYTATFEFKNGRYRISFQLNKLYIGGQYANEWTFDTYYNPKKGVVRKLNEPKVDRITKIVNDLFLNHYKSLASNKTEDDW